MNVARTRPGKQLDSRALAAAVFLALACKQLWDTLLASPTPPGVTEVPLGPSLWTSLAMVLRVSNTTRL